MTREHQTKLKMSEGWRVWNNKGPVCESAINAPRDRGQIETEKERSPKTGKEVTKEVGLRKCGKKKKKVGGEKERK